MNYAVTVDTSRPEGTSELDELQRAGVVHLLGGAFDAIDAIEGEDGEVVEITNHFIGVHPQGALLKVFVDAPSLEDAEDAIEALVGDILENLEPLAGWSIDRCEVQLHLDSAKESLEAADGPHAPSADPVTRAATHRATRPTAAPEPTADGPSPDEMRTTLQALAPKLAGTSPSTFGHLTPQDLDGEEASEEFNVARPVADLAAGAVFHSIDILLDEIFEDIATLNGSPNVAQCDGPLLQLESLPEKFAHLYTPLFAQQLLVTAVDLTARLSRPGFTQLSCVAEELLLRMLLETTEVTLDLYGLLDDDVQEALAAFRENVYEDLDHETLYDPALDGLDESPVGEALGMAPMGVADWFEPFSAGRPVHPYAVAPAVDNVQEGPDSL
ncbi:hypothetical protein ACWEO1_18510 [Kitasatospora cineracea]